MKFEHTGRRPDSGIYLIKNLINGKIYVGSAVWFSRRYRQHKHELSLSTHGNSKLQNAVNKYGIDNFVFLVQEECAPCLLIEREQYWIDVLGAIEYGYNLLPTAGSQYGFKHSEDSKKKMSISAKKRLQDPEERKKIGEYRKGTKLSAKHIEAIKRYASGRDVSNETRYKLSLANKGKRPSDFTILRSIEINKIRKRTTEESNKRSLSMKLKWDDPAYGRKRLAQAINCERCGKSFNGYPGRRFCSKSCSNKRSISAL